MVPSPSNVAINNIRRKTTLMPIPKRNSSVFKHIDDKKNITEVDSGGSDNLSRMSNCHFSLMVMVSITISKG